MKRVTINHAANATGLFDVHRFKARTKEERTAAWLAYRANGVGGSDMSTILGINPYATPYDLWLEKTGRTEPEDISDRWAVERGNALEDVLRRRFRRLHPEWKVIDGTDVSLVSREHPVMHASLDGFIYDSQHDEWGVLEIKTASAHRGRTDWHDADDNLIAPPYYAAQVTHYLAVTGFSFAVFYADLGEAEPVEVRVERDDEDCEAVIKAAEDFWGYVERGEMPQLTGSADVLKAYPDDDGTMEQVADLEFDRLCALYRAHSDAAAAEKKAIASIRDQIAPLIADRKGLISADWKATYATQHRAEHVVKESSTRVLRVSKVKTKED